MIFCVVSSETTNDEFVGIKKEYPEIKMIYGCELYECKNIEVKDKDNKYFHLICLIRNEQGRKDLNKVITKSNFEGFKDWIRNLIMKFRTYKGDRTESGDYRKIHDFLVESENEEYTYARFDWMMTNWEYLEDQYSLMIIIMGIMNLSNPQ